MNAILQNMKLILWKFSSPLGLSIGFLHILEWRVEQKPHSCLQHGSKHPASQRQTWSHAHPEFQEQTDNIFSATYR